VRIIFASTPVGPLGSGIGGGVELTLRTLADELARRGYVVDVVAPRGSRLDGVDAACTVHPVDGVLHVPSQTLARDETPVVPAGSVLAAMWDVIDDIARAGDVVLNFAYDELPFERTVPGGASVAHLVSMGSLSDGMDRAVRSAVMREPRNVAMHSRAQAMTFGADVADAVTIVASGIDTTRYDFVAEPEDVIGFVGRVSPEKGIDDLFAVAERDGREVRVWGVKEDERCWEEARRAHPGANVTWRGFLPTDALQAEIGRCRAIVMVHKWVEAFGNVAIEALACGVPVVTYARGGPAEIVTDGVTGRVVVPDDVDAVVSALAGIGAIDRRRCRELVMASYTREAFGGRVEAWLAAVPGVRP
jgi:UDP-glucose:tetrahydrobiopterin glucosyltransferase